MGAPRLAGAEVAASISAPCVSLRCVVDRPDMPREQGCCILRIACAQGGKDRPVIAVGRPFPFGPPAGEQEAGAGRVQIVDGAQQPRHAAGRQDQAVKTAVGLFPGVDVMGTVAGKVRLFGRVENGPGQMRRGIAQGECFQRGPHFGDLAHLVRREAGDPHPAPRLALDQPLGLQAPERFAHRHMAGAEFLGDMILAQSRARLDPAGDDAGGQFAADPDGKGFVFRTRHEIIDNPRAARRRGRLTVPTNGL